MTAGAIKAPIIMPLRPPEKGKPKAYLDTQTRIELFSETPDTDIFFTINGSKPDPFQTTGVKSTYLYRQPFNLPAGKRTVKAVAITKDRFRESNVVTKTFDVELVKDATMEKADTADMYGFLEELKMHEAMAASGDRSDKQMPKSYIRQKPKPNEAWNDTTGTGRLKSVEFSESLTPSQIVSATGARRPKGNARFTASRFDKLDGKEESRLSDTIASLNLEGSFNEGKSKRLLPPDNSVQAMRIQRETDFLKCVYCLAPRPADPFARYCNACGQPVPPLPQTRLPPPESGQLGVCVHCRSTVPLNVPACLVCEAPLQPQNQPQASLRLLERVLCPVCGTANPPQMDSCLTCETRLPPHIRGRESLPPPPSTPLLNSTIGLLPCRQCNRQNNPDARFCDWCGTKTAPLTSGGATGGGGISELICGKCAAHNQAYARFCGQCGGSLEPPPRHLAASRAGAGQWVPVTIPLSDSMGAPGGVGPVAQVHYLRRTSPCDVSTQTVGLFYPSTAGMKRRETEEEDRTKLEKDMRDRALLLTVVSPGKGYWRKQIDHIVAHLKAYANNNAEFRALIGEPRMAKMLSAEVHEDGYELNLSLTFALRNYKDPYKGQPVGTGQQYLSSMTRARANSMDSFRSDETGDSVVNYDYQLQMTPTGSRAQRRPKKKTARKSVRSDDVKLSLQDKALLREIGKNGEGRGNEVQQLVDEGANPNCVNGEKLSALIIAVRNKHKEVIPVLVSSGADVNGKGPEKGNTALHEAVLLGLDGEELVNVLLGSGANSQRKNDRGESAYDLAVKVKCDPIIKLFTSKIGQSQLDKMLQPSQANAADKF